MLQPDPGTAAKVAFLKCPDTYTEGTDRVEVAETHMSWIFLTNRFAYKIKKPIHRDFLDFTTLDARRRNCESEVRLNRRFAGDVYIGIVPLVMKPSGSLALEGTGKPVEWLVKMHRLPKDCMLDYAIRHNQVDMSALEHVGHLLANIYKNSTPIAIKPINFRQRIERDIDTNLRELSKPMPELSIESAQRVAGAQLAFLDREWNYFERRVSGGKIIEAHGDLRPEHICLRSSPVIIDCLEFNRDFRLLDPVDELAFLAVECERMGAAFVGDCMFGIYRNLTLDDPSQALVHFYKSCRAILRARLAVWHAEDPCTRTSAQWYGLAREYLRLAAGHLEAIGQEGT
jgi:aminoglycoside phosphotransferase family enzyme